MFTEIYTGFIWKARIKSVGQRVGLVPVCSLIFSLPFSCPSLFSRYSCQLAFSWSLLKGYTGKRLEDRRKCKSEYLNPSSSVFADISCFTHFLIWLILEKLFSFTWEEFYLQISLGYLIHHLFSPWLSKGRVRWNIEWVTMLMEFYGKGIETNKNNSTPRYIYPREMKTYIHKKIWTPMVLAVLFEIAPKWKQPKGPSAGKWVDKKCVSIQWNTIEQYRRKKILIYPTTLINFKNILLGERCQIPGHILYDSIYLKHPQIANL